MRGKMDKNGSYARWSVEVVTDKKTIYIFMIEIGENN